MTTPQYAGFWIRAAANIIDAIILVIVIAGPLTYIYGVDYWAGEQLFYGVWDVMLGYVLPILATIWFWLTYRATPGKLLTGLQIVDANTMQTMSFGQSVGRYIAYIFALIPFAIGVIWVAFDPRKQGWHDKLAKTVVIKEL